MFQLYKFGSSYLTTVECNIVLHSTVQYTTKLYRYVAQQSIVQALLYHALDSEEGSRALTMPLYPP